jgi:hypothetical protein
MSNVDTLVTRDLAAAATANRDRLVAIDDTLRAVGASASIVAPGPSARSELRLLVVANIYAARIGRAASGIAALACVLAVVVWDVTAFTAMRSYSGNLLGAGPLVVASRLVVVVLGVRLLAGAWASAAFARAVEVSPPRAERLLAGSERWALVLGIVGTFVFLMTFGVAYFTLQTDPLDYIACAFDTNCSARDPGAEAYRAPVLHLAIVLPVASVAALAVVRRAPAWLSRAGIIAAGLMILATTLCIGYRYDIGPWGPDEVGGAYVPNLTLRLGLTISGAIGMLLALTAFALWRRRLERERIASASSSS